MATQLLLGDATFSSLPDHFDLFVSVVLVLYSSLVAALTLNLGHVMYRCVAGGRLCVCELPVKLACLLRAQPRR